MSCGHYEAGWGTCGRTSVRRYLTGDRCEAHTPAQLAGRPEPVPDPALTLDGIRAEWYAARDLEPPEYMTPAGETVVDDRAVASGKRRSNPDRFRDAQRAVAS